MRPQVTGQVVGFLPNFRSPKSEPPTSLPPSGSEVFPRPSLLPFVLSPVSSVEERWIGSLESIAQNDSDGLLVTLQKWPLLALRRDNSFGFTLLHYAAFSNSSTCASILLQHRADIHSRDNSAGLSPSDLAIMNNSHEVVLLFSQLRDRVRPPTSARYCTFYRDPLEQYQHDAHTIAQNQSFRPLPGSSCVITKENPSTCTTRDELHVPNQCRDCDENFTVFFDTSLDALRQIENCTPDAAKEVFSIPVSPQSMFSMELDKLHPKSSRASFERTNNSMLHTSREDGLHHQARRHDDHRASISESLRSSLNMSLITIHTMNRLLSSMHSEIEKLRLEKIKNDVALQIQHQTVIFSSTVGGFSASKETSADAIQQEPSNACYRLCDGACTGPKMSNCVVKESHVSSHSESFSIQGCSVYC